MFNIDWHVTSVGKRYPIGGVWSTKVSEHLRAHGFNLAMDKEVYREKLTELYLNSDLCNETVGNVNTAPSFMEAANTATFTPRYQFIESVSNDTLN